jgi:membrane protein YqaA with SNARE-associated domain
VYLQMCVTNTLLTSCSENCNILFLLHSSVPIVPWLFCILTGAYV